MGADPIETAFRGVLGEVYWSETLEEAEEKLAGFLRSMDEDLREVLLERRRRFCSDKRRIAGMLAALAEAEEAMEAGGPEGSTARAAFVGMLVASSYIMQCTPTWQTMEPERKARILAPLYRASYAYEQYTRTGREEYLDEAARMVMIALRRAARMGVLDEVRDFVQEVIEELGLDDEDEEEGDDARWA